MEDLGELRARITADARQIKAELRQVKELIKDQGEQAKKTSRDFDALDTSLAAIGSGAALYGLVRVIQSVTEEANQMQMSLKGLIEVSKALGINVDATTKAAQDLAAKGFMTVQQSAEALKNLLPSLGLEKSVELINVMGDAAAYNRQSQYSWGEAIVASARGIKNQNSELTDAVGITKNLSRMYEDYAQSIGTSAVKLTDAQKAQAAYNGFLQEAALFAGNAETALNEYVGTQTDFNKSIELARVELGEAFMPVMEELMQKLTPLIVDFTKWAEENKEVVAGLAAAGVAVTGLTALITGLITVVAALRAAFIALNISMGPIGWIIAGLGLVTSGVLAYTSAADAAAKTSLKFASSQEELNQKLQESPLSQSAQEVQALQEDIEALNGIMGKRIELQEKLDGLMEKARNGQGSIQNTHEAMELGEAIGKIDEQLRNMDFETPEKAAEALGKMKEQVKGAIPALLELKKAEGAEIAAKVEHIDRIKKLNERYKELNGLEKLNASQKAELASVVEQLKRAYPGMITYLDEEGKWHIRNAEAIDTKIEAEKTFVENSAEGMKIYLNNLKATTTAQISEINKQISKLEELSAAYGKAVEETPETTKIIQKINPAAVAGMQTDSELQAKYDERNRLLMSDNEIDKALASITSGSFDDFKVKPPGSAGGPSAATAAKSIADQRAKSFALDMDTMRFRAEMQEWSKEQQIKALEELRKKHKAYLEESVQDERSIALEIKHLQDDIAAEKVESDERARKEQFQNSLDWIEEEKYYQRLSLEEELAAWQRVMNRYAAGSEERKQAEREVFRVEQELNEQRLQMAEKLEQKREESIKVLKSETVDAIKDMRRAEMDAIADRKESIERKYDEELDLIERNKREALDSYDEQKRAIEDTYRDTVNQMDESNYNRERKELVDEMEKYRLSASKKGQDRYQQLQEQLRELDERERRRDLQNERDDKLRNLEDQRRDTEGYYDDLRRMKEEEKRQDLLDLEEQQEAVQTFYDEVEAIFADSATEIENIEKTMQDNRLSQLQTTNQQMLTELENYVRDYENILKQTSGPLSGDREVISQMQANAINWNQTSDPAARARLEQENERLGAQLGASKSKGVWYKDGRRLFHTGGTGDFNFRSPNNLMPDEIAAIIKRTEFVFQPKQLGALLDHQQGGGGVNHNYNAPLVEVKEMVVRDEQDAVIVSREFYNLQQNQIRSKGRRAT